MQRPKYLVVLEGVVMVIIRPVRVRRREMRMW